MLGTLRQTKALALLTLRYWARAGVPNRLRKDQGRRASGAVVRVAFLLLMVNWGYRIGIGVTRLDYEHRPQGVAWLLLGLASLSTTWGAMGRGPGMRTPRSVLVSPLLDTLPLRESSRVAVGLIERLILYALVAASLLAVVPAWSIATVLLGIALPTAGLLLGDALLRLVRTVLSPLRMGTLAAVVLVLQFPSFMLVGGAPVLAKLPRASSVLRPLLPFAARLVQDGNVALPLAASVLVALFAALLFRVAERVGYDRVDLVPDAKLGKALASELDLVRVERVLARREPGGSWLVRGAFFYTAATSVGLVLLARLSKSFPTESAAALVRTLAYVGIFSGFAVVQARATRLVLRDASARPMLGPLPIEPRDLVRGKTRGVMIQALVVIAPFFLLLALPSSLGLRFEVLWRGGAAAGALVLAAGAAVSVAFLTQGLGGVKVLGGTLGLETTLIGVPLLAVAAAPQPWSAVVSVVTLGLLAFEARRSALRCIRWIDDDADSDGETVVWRALLVFASFMATQTLLRRLIAFAPLDERAQSTVASVVALLVLLALTYFGRRGLPRIVVVPPSRAAGWLAAALVAGALVGAASVAYPLGLRRLGVVAAPLIEGDRRWWMVVPTMLVASFAEELFFRGWLQGAIASELAPHRRWLAPLLGAFAFAVLQPPLTSVPAFVLGAISGLFYARSRSVLPSVLVHATALGVILLGAVLPAA